MKSEESPLFMAGKTLKGKRTQFKAGMAPWNKGIPYLPAVALKQPVCTRKRASHVASNRPPSAQ